MAAQHAQVRTADDVILAIGYFPAGSADPSIEVVPMTPAITAAWDTPGTKVLNGDGTVTVIPPPVVPPPKSAYRTVVVEDFRTTDATQATLASWPLAVQTLYTARFTILAVDTVNGDCRVWTAKATAKRLGAGALLIGTPTLETSHADAGAASWALAADTNSNNFRVRVTGAAGRTISWSLVGEVLRARPSGLAD
jgi:hypothetical protein